MKGRVLGPHKVVENYSIAFTLFKDAGKAGQNPAQVSRVANRLRGHCRIQYQFVPLFWLGEYLLKTLVDNPASINSNQLEYPPYPEIIVLQNLLFKERVWRMKQKTLTTLFLLMLTVTLLTGCNNEPLKPQFVVINIVEIAEAMGFSEQLKERTETMKQQISEEIKVLSAKLSKEFEDEKAGLGDSPSEEDEKRIRTLREQLRTQIAQARKEGNERRAKEISEVRQSYLDDIMSVAQKVALEHGASIILKAMGIFWSDGAVDITDEVIGRMPGSNAPPPA